MVEGSDYHNGHCSAHLSILDTAGTWTSATAGEYLQNDYRKRLPLLVYGTHRHHGSDNSRFLEKSEKEGKISGFELTDLKETLKNSHLIGDLKPEKNH